MDMAANVITVDRFNELHKSEACVHNEDGIFSVENFGLNPINTTTLAIDVSEELTQSLSKGRSLIDCWGAKRPPEDRKEITVDDYLEKIRKRGLNSFQLHEVEEGLKNGLDTEQIDIFAKSEYDHMQMQEIRLALEHGFTLKQISVFLDPSINYEAMNHARIKLQNENVIEEKARAKLHAMQLKNLFVVILILFLIGVAVVGGYFGRKYWLIFNQPMELKLKSTHIDLGYGDAFNPIDYIDEYTKDDGVQLVLPNAIDTKHIGQVKVIYTLKNQLKSISKELTVNIQDKNSPVITLNTKDITLTRTKDSFNGKSYLSSAMDDVDGDVTEHVTWTNPDESINDQTITYSVKDKAGNESQSVLSLHYKDPEPAPTPETIVIYQPSGGGGNTSGGRNAPQASPRLMEHSILCSQMGIPWILDTVHA